MHGGAFPGVCFGEIALLGTGNMNRRTANVRAHGFTSLYVLFKGIFINHVDTGLSNQSWLFWPISGQFWAFLDQFWPFQLSVQHFELL